MDSGKMTAMFYTLLLVSIFFISCRADEAVIQAPFDKSGSQAPFDDAASKASFDELENVETKLDLALLPPYTDEDRFDKLEPLIGIAQNHQNRLDSHLEKVAEKMDTRKKKVYKNCKALYKAGHTTSGVYTIRLNRKKVTVYCEQKLKKGGWTVFQRRINGSVNFNRGWDDYKQGFGSAAGEYWIGNDNLYALTSKRRTQLLVELQYKGKTRYAKYRSFSVQDESNKYKLQVAGYRSGSIPGDSLTQHNNFYFTTHDRDNDIAKDLNCGTGFRGAWWYHNCFDSSLNGIYSKGATMVGIFWKSWVPAKVNYGVVSLHGATMMIK